MTWAKATSLTEAAHRAWSFNTPQSVDVYPHSLSTLAYENHVPYAPVISWFKNNPRSAKIHRLNHGSCRWIATAHAAGYLGCCRLVHTKLTILLYWWHQSNKVQQPVTCRDRTSKYDLTKSTHLFGQKSTVNVKRNAQQSNLPWSNMYIYIFARYKMYIIHKSTINIEKYTYTILTELENKAHLLLVGKGDKAINKSQIAKSKSR